MSADTFYEEPQLLDTLVAFDEDRSTGELLIQRTQEIPDDWLADVAKQKVDSVNTRFGDFGHLASIPVEVVDDIYRKYGFDIMSCPSAREILAMLRRYEFDKFILTNKRV
ncbi:hypothetical protein [Bradyrhizobium sp. USDA 4350]